MDSAFFLLDQATCLIVLAVWEMDRAGRLGSLGDVGKMSVTPCEPSSAGIRFPSHCAPGPSCDLSGFE